MVYILTSLLLSFVALASAHPDSRRFKVRETNADRLKRGLGPMAPRRLYEPRHLVNPYDFRALNKRDTTYSITDTYIGEDFLTGFNWEAEADPTHGRVNYLSQQDAINDGLLTYTATTLKAAADDITVLDPSGPGRNSQRFRSNNAYSVAVIVLDLAHMPSGCGTWPAFWTVDEADWPNEGEIDIIEYVNDAGPNSETLHTSSNCSQPASGRSMTGNVVSTDCNVAVNGNQGCSVASSHADSYGAPFNAAGGGWWAMERTTTSISIWFWDRSDTSVPASVSEGQGTVDTSTFGTPDSTFVNTNCDIPSHFGQHNIIFDLTFCGDWAGNAYPSGNSACPGSGMTGCVDFVNNNPSAFSNAYWLINSLRVYE